MFLKKLCVFALLYLLFGGLPAARGQGQAAQGDNGGIVAGNPIDYATARFSRIATAVRTDEEIVIDGVLEEAAWETASPAGDFIQFEPSPGAAATEPTELYFLYDDNNLYVAAICFQSDPRSIVATELQKDFGTTDNDGIAFILDTLHDLRSGFVFGTNPAGARFDSQTANDGGVITGTGTASGMSRCGFMTTDGSRSSWFRSRPSVSRGKALRNGASIFADG